jgi:hypothetical protein
MLREPLQTNFAKALVKGQRYLITYRFSHQRRNRQFVGVYLGVNPALDELAFSLRPASGTSTIKERDIISSVCTNKPCGVC